MRFSQAVSGALVIPELEALIADCSCASDLSVFALDYKGGLFSEEKGPLFLWEEGKADKELVAQYREWGAKTCIYTAMAGGPRVFVCPAGFFFGVSPIILDDVCYGAILIGPAVPESDVMPPEVVLMDEHSKRDGNGERTARFRERFSELKELYQKGTKISPLRLQGLLKLLDRALTGLLQKELVGRLISDCERKSPEEETQRNGDSVIEIGNTGAVYEKLRHAFQRHVYRECVNIAHNRIYEIYDEEPDEVERYRKLADFFLVLARVSAEFHAPLSEIILKDVESNTFIKTLTRGRFFVFRMAEGYIARIFREIDRSYQYQSGMEKALNYIDSHIREDISLEAAAQTADLNSYYFSKVFKKNMAVNFVNYLSARRMDIAGEMLLYTDLSVSDIAEEVSYGAETGYFSKIFKKYFGVTPSEFRQISQEAMGGNNTPEKKKKADVRVEELRLPSSFRLRNRHLMI